MSASVYDELVSTPPYVEEEEDIATLALSNLGFELYEQELQNKFSARFQIHANLKNSNSYQNYDHRLLQLPMVCIGTGRNTEALSSVHRCRTLIQPFDVSIDVQARIAPDHVCDCFQVSYANLTSRSSFGTIFFAHVHFCGLPLDDDTKKSLTKYHDRLINGGYFVYNSEVIQRSQLSMLVAAHEGINSFDDLSANWIKLLHDVGFQRIEVIIKDESLCFTPEAISILIIALKPQK